MLVLSSLTSSRHPILPPPVDGKTPYNSHPNYFMNTVHFSSATDDWETPQYFFNEWNSIFHFQLDACATSENAKAENYYTIAQDALTQEWAWAGMVWMNPPYGRHIGKWMQKAYQESCRGCVVVCLIPARTDTKWWHDYATKGVIHFIPAAKKEVALHTECDSAA